METYIGVHTVEAVASQTRNRSLQGGVCYPSRLAGMKVEQLRSAEVKTEYGSRSEDRIRQQKN
jgi:hypothetical protein